MRQQSFRNHRRLSFLFHGVTGISLLVLIIGSINNLLHAQGEHRYSASLIVLVSFILLSLFFHSRMFGLKAQDRAIRAEENFRHFILTGKPFDSRLRIHQIIALRFASDEEMPTLAQKAVDKNLSNKEIKEAIKNWRADNHRV